MSTRNQSKNDNLSTEQSSTEKKKRKVNPRRLVSAVVAFVFVAYFVYTMIWQQVVISQKGREIDALEEKIAAAEQQTKRLEKELEDLNDPEYLEKIAREKLGLVRPNERVFVDANQSNPDGN